MKPNLRGSGQQEKPSMAKLLYFCQKSNTPLPPSLPLGWTLHAAAPGLTWAFWQNYTLLEQKGIVFDIFINC